METIRVPGFGMKLRPPRIARLAERLSTLAFHDRSLSISALIKKIWFSASANRPVRNAYTVALAAARNEIATVSIDQRSSYQVALRGTWDQ